MSGEGGELAGGRCPGQMGIVRRGNALEPYGRRDDAKIMHQSFVSLLVTPLPCGEFKLILQEHNAAQGGGFDRFYPPPPITDPGAKYKLLHPLCILLGL